MPLALVAYPAPHVQPQPEPRGSRASGLARHRRTRTRTACTRLRAGRRRTTHACTSRSTTHTTMHIIPPTATAARTLQPTTAATRQLQSWTVSSLERPHAESSSPAMRLVGQGGRQHHCKVTNYEFERVAHTELHTPGLLVTRRGARSCPGWSATRSAAVAEPA